MNAPRYASTTAHQRLRKDPTHAEAHRAPATCNKTAAAQHTPHPKAQEASIPWVGSKSSSKAVCKCADKTGGAAAAGPTQ